MTAPTWITSAGSIGTLNEGSPFSFALVADNNAGSPFTYTLISGSLPPGLTLDAPSGTVYGNIPLSPFSGIYQFTVRATNVDGIADRTFSITVIEDGIVWHSPSNLGIFLNQSYFSYLLYASEPGDSKITYTLISGSLPAGLDFQSNGLISGYLAPISSPTEVYTFTVSANGVFSSPQLFTLTVTSLGVHSPQWNTISAYNIGNGLEGGDLGNLSYNVPYSFQLQAVKPAPGGPGPLVYSIVLPSILPPGLTMNSSGFISGTLTSQAVSIYPLYIQVTDGLNSVTVIFYMRTNYVDADVLYWVVNQNTIPVDLSLMTTGETTNFSIGVNSYQITKNPTQVTFDQGLVNEIIIQDRLPQASSLIVVLQSTGVYSVYQSYIDNVYNSFTLTVITPGNYVFNLGSIDIGQPSVFTVNGISLSQWVRYEIVSGSLPAGLDLNVTNGNIEGSIQNQTPGTYAFALRVYNYTLFQDLDFSITVTLPATFMPNKLTARIPELGKIDWYNIFDLNLIPSINFYRPADSNFGTNVLPEVVILSEMNALTAEQIYDTICPASNTPLDVVTTTLTPQSFIYTPVTDENANVICEAVLLQVKDAFRDGAISYTIPTEKNPAPNQPVTIYPRGLQAIRQIFIDQDNATDSLENWMNYYFQTDIVNNKFNAVNSLPNFNLGDVVSFNNQILPDPFENDLYYYVIPVSPTSFQLATTLAAAQAGNYLPFDVNDAGDLSGTLQFYFPALPIAFVTTGTGASAAAAFNNQQNIVPFGYYTMTSNGFTDTFFMTTYGNDLNTGDPIKFWDEPLPGPFIFGYIYYAIVVNNTTFKLAATKQDAINNNPITITGYIDDRTNAPYSGSFKKLLLTDNNTIIVDEVDTRFTIPVEVVFSDNRFKFKAFTATSSNGYFNLPNHGLETSLPVEFKNQLTLSSPFVNDQVYYAIVIDENNFQLASSVADTWVGTYISFATNFTGYLNVDTAQAVFINTINQFNFYTIEADNLFVANQTVPMELGYIVQLVQTKDTIPAPFATLTDYYVIPTTNGNAFRLSDPTNPTVPLIIPSDFSGNILIGNNFSEYNWRR
jgi:hypothetical protein